MCMIYMASCPKRTLNRLDVCVTEGQGDAYSEVNVDAVIVMSGAAYIRLKPRIWPAPQRSAAAWHRQLQLCSTSILEVS